MNLSIKNSSGEFIDITPYIAYGGVKYSSSPLTSGKELKTMSGKVYRGWIADKDEISLGFISLTDAQTEMINSLVGHEYFTARYYSLAEGCKVEREMYVEDRSISYAVEYDRSLDGSSSVQFKNGIGYSSGNGGYTSTGSIITTDSSKYSNSKIRIYRGFKVKSARYANATINYVKEDGSFVSNCFDGRIKTSITIKDSDIPVGVKYINITCEKVNDSRITVERETAYWSQLQLTLKER